MSTFPLTQDCATKKRSTYRISPCAYILRDIEPPKKDVIKMHFDSTFDLFLKQLIILKNTEKQISQEERRLLLLSLDSLLKLRTLLQNEDS